MKIKLSEFINKYRCNIGKGEIVAKTKTRHSKRDKFFDAFDKEFGLKPIVVDGSRNQRLRG